MLDPRDGEVLALASTPTYDASAITDPVTADEAFAALRDDEDQPLLPRATLGRYVPGSVFKIVTAIAGLGSGAVSAGDDLRGAAGGRGGRPARRGLPRSSDGHHPETGDRRPRPHRGDRGLVQHLVRPDRPARPAARPLVDYAERLGFGAPLPFDLPTAVSQVTNGDGDAAGRLRRRRRAGQRRLRPGRDVRDPAPDGARGRDRGQRRRADAAAAGDGDDRQERRRGRSGRSASAGSSTSTTPGPSTRRWSRRSRATSASASRPAPRSRA